MAFSSQCTAREHRLAEPHQAGGPSYREAKGGALRLDRVAERWDKFPGSRVWLLSSAIRSRPLPLLKGEGEIGDADADGLQCEELHSSTPTTGELEQPRLTVYKDLGSAMPGVV